MLGCWPQGCNACSIEGVHVCWMAEVAWYDGEGPQLATQVAASAHCVLTPAVWLYDDWSEALAAAAALPRKA